MKASIYSAKTGESSERTLSVEEAAEFRSSLPAIQTNIDNYENAVQELIDATAKERGYRSGDSIASFALSTNPQWAAEAQAFIAWRDNVWRYVYGEHEKFLSGTLVQPTVEQFLAEKAPISWPAPPSNL